MVALSFCSSASASAASTASRSLDSLTTCAALDTSESARFKARSSSRRSPSGSALAALITATVCLAADFSASSFIPASVRATVVCAAGVSGRRECESSPAPPRSPSKSAPKTLSRSRSAAAVASSRSISARSVRIPAISRSFSLSTVRKVSSSSSYVSMESVEPEPLRLPLLDPLLDEGDGHVLLDAYRPLMSSEPPGSAVVDATASAPSPLPSASIAASKDSSRGWYLTLSRTSFAVGTSSGGRSSGAASAGPALSKTFSRSASRSAAFCLYPLTTAPGTLATPPRPPARTVLYPWTTPLADLEKTPPTPRPTPLTPPHTRPTNPRDSPSPPNPPMDLMSAPAGGSSSAATGTGPHCETAVSTSTTSPLARIACARSSSRTTEASPSSTSGRTIFPVSSSTTARVYHRTHSNCARGSSTGSVISLLLSMLPPGSALTRASLWFLSTSKSATGLRTCKPTSPGLTAAPS